MCRSTAPTARSNTLPGFPDAVSPSTSTIPIPCWPSARPSRAGAREGGIAGWLKLTGGLGLDPDYVISTRGILAGTRFAVDAYVRFVRERSLLEAVASSLTELFSPAIIGERVEGMLEGYDFVTRETLAYFEKRPPQAERDSGFALAYGKANASTPHAPQAVLAALRVKCHVLWAMLDALDHAYVAPKHVPPGAFVPKE